MAITKNTEQQAERDEPTGKKRGLGRGLSALFGDEEDDMYPVADTDAQAGGVQRRMAGIDQLEPGTYQPRRHMDQESLAELAASIAVHGVLQPILVRPVAGAQERYEIIAGERRWRAAQKAQLHEVPVIIRTLDDKQASEIALIENLQREDLNPLEEAQGYKRLMDEFGHTQEKLAAGLGKSRSHIANMVRLLNLPQGVQMLVRQGKLSAGHARTLITAADPDNLAKQIIMQGYSVRDAERLVAAQSGKTGARKAVKAAPAGKDVDTLALERDMTNRLGLNVAINVKNDGKGGQLVIDFKSLDQLDDVLRRLSQN